MGVESSGGSLFRERMIENLPNILDVSGEEEAQYLQKVTRALVRLDQEDEEDPEGIRTWWQNVVVPLQRALEEVLENPNENLKRWAEGRARGRKAEIINEKYRSQINRERRKLEDIEKRLKEEKGREEGWKEFAIYNGAKPLSGHFIAEESVVHSFILESFQDQYKQVIRTLTTHGHIFDDWNKCFRDGSQGDPLSERLRERQRDQSPQYKGLPESIYDDIEAAKTIWKEINPSLQQLREQWEGVLSQVLESQLEAQGEALDSEVQEPDQAPQEEEAQEIVDAFLDQNQNNLFLQRLADAGLLDSLKESLKAVYQKVKREAKERVKQRMMIILPMEEERSKLEAKIEVLEREQIQAIGDITITEDDIRKELRFATGQTTLAKWCEYSSGENRFGEKILAVAPRAAVIFNPQPRPESTAARGFGGEASIGERTGNICLYFPKGQGRFKSIVFEEFETASAGLSEKYKVTEIKPDGSDETYQMIIDNQGVSFICADGQKSQIVFGQPQSFIGVIRKPVIYVYSRKERQTRMRVSFKGRVIFTYPLPVILNKGEKTEFEWDFKVKGNEVFYHGQKYPYLFWEGRMEKIGNSKMDEGFVVANIDLSSFLEEKLTLLGLNRREISDFITYWCAYLHSSPWIFIRFDKQAYEAIAELNIEPRPELLIRVFAIFKQLSQKIEVKPQNLEALKPASRKKVDFVVVEWGGVLMESDS